MTNLLSKQTYHSSQARAPLLFQEGVLSAISPYLLHDIYTNHNCNLCSDLTTNYHKLAQANRTYMTPILVTEPKLFPSTWEHKAPPVFLHQTANIKTGLTLQELLKHGLTFQQPQEDQGNPFLTSFQEILNLKENQPPLTSFKPTKQKQPTYNRYSKLLASLKQSLNKENLQILSPDKGPGLLLVPTFTVMRSTSSTYQ
ncbi:hypothetical protein LOD99_1994 [Oopsacas minuta]|uniref:Uncharacterized protein n=1 Tax=Oopsacas minuta TaxID=111878 RepID=A0AAV7K4H8_9METZ|nr:hypothetical protein LOD99_1994 [Oopsacas minuta]